jgi:molecular chaperone HscB
MQNHFDLFQLPARFTLDMGALDAAYRDVQGQVHPDRFVGATDAEKRVAMQWATRANEAYQTLRNPMKRARYLCEQNGVDLQTESNTAMPMDFLMQQMEWREAVAEARAAHDARGLRKLQGDLAHERGDMLRLLERALDAEANFDAGCSLVRKLRFLDKLEEEIDAALEPMSPEAR